MMKRIFWWKIILDSCSVLFCFVFIPIILGCQSILFPLTFTFKKCVIVFPVGYFSIQFHFASSFASFFLYLKTDIFNETKITEIVNDDDDDDDNQTTELQNVHSLNQIDNNQNNQKRSNNKSNKMAEEEVSFIWFSWLLLVFLLFVFCSNKIGFLLLFRFRVVKFIIIFVFYLFVYID